MTQSSTYEDLVARNSGYISEDTQAKIRQTRLLIAGCGIGSSLAVCAARIPRGSPASKAGSKPRRVHNYQARRALAALGGAPRRGLSRSPAG